MEKWDVYTLFTSLVIWVELSIHISFVFIISTVMVSFCEVTSLSVYLVFILSAWLWFVLRWLMGADIWLICFSICVKDVKRWLADLRGKDMPDAFTWSYKRYIIQSYPHPNNEKVSNVLDIYSERKEWCIYQMQEIISPKQQFNSIVPHTKTSFEWQEVQDRLCLAGLARWWSYHSYIWQWICHQRIRDFEYPIWWVI